MRYKRFLDLQFLFGGGESGLVCKKMDRYKAA